MRRKAMLILVAALVIGGGWLAQTLAQPREGDQPRRDRGGDREARMRQWRERTQQRQREQLGASEEEWKVLQPRIEKVQTLQRQARGGFRGRMGGRMGRRGRRPAGDQPADAPQREQSEVEKKTEALRKLLADENANAGAIKAALEALRRAREQVAKDLAAARKELRDVCTVRQEAQLVLTNVLD